jgi:hypothetical protein
MSDHPLAACPDCGQALWTTSPTCPKCGADVQEWLTNLDLRPETAAGNADANGVRTEIPEPGQAESDFSGHIYILRNPHFSHLLKIGKTTRSPEERATELSSATGVPGDFQVIWKMRTSDCDSAERLIQEELREQRVDGEFFAVDLSQAVDIVTRICSGVPKRGDRSAMSESRAPGWTPVGGWPATTAPTLPQPARRAEEGEEKQVTKPRISMTKGLSLICPNCGHCYSVTVVRYEQHSFCPKCGVRHGIQVSW